MFEVTGSTGKKYTIHQSKGAFVCSCPAWKFQKTPGDARTCRHIKELATKMLAHAA